MKDLPAEGPSPQDSLREWRERILDRVFYGLVFFGLFALIEGVTLRIDDGRADYAALYLFLYAALLLATFVRGLGFTPRALILLGVLYVWAVTGFLLLGLSANGPVFLFAAVALATILLGLRSGIAVLLLSVVTMLCVSAAFALGWTEEPVFQVAGSLAHWLGKAALFLGLGAATIISTAFLLRRLEGSVETSADLVLSLKEHVQERERAEEALRKSEARLLEAQRVGRIGSFEWDFGTGTLWWSDEMYRLMGWEIGALEPRFEAFLEQVDSEDRKRVEAAVQAWLAGEGLDSLECRMVLPSGPLLDARAQPRLERGADGEPVRLHGTVQDVTEARKLEDQLRQSQKLEAVGQLAGGVAHDFNNFLTVIKGYGESLAADLDGEPQEAAREVCLAAESATALTRQLLAFGRRQYVQPRALDLNALVQKFQGMLGRLIGEDVAFALSLDPSLGRVMADPGQMEQILLNLVLNARDAMPRGGNLEVQTYEVDTLSEPAVAASDSKPARSVCLSVCDDGCGMDGETQARIFEPFFTTKEPEKGTGLGLSTVYGIVKQCGGEICVRSSPGHGTTVEILLPRVDESKGAATADSAGLGAEHRGSETILVVEDEGPVRRVTRETLEQGGYRVLEARDGAEALAMMRGHREELDLVLTDVVMPRMGGVALVDQLREEFPKIRVLFMSGYANRAASSEAFLPEGAALLEKPFGPREIIERVRETLDA